MRQIGTLNFKTLGFQEVQDCQEHIAYIRNVFPGDKIFNYLVEEGAQGNEEFTLMGDDLAGACWALHELMNHFEVK